MKVNRIGCFAFVALLAMVCGNPVIAQVPHIGFNGAGDGTNWEDINNWEDGVGTPTLPFLGAFNDEFRTFIGTNGHIDGPPAGTLGTATVELSSDQTIGTLHLGNNGNGTLNHSAGKLTAGWTFTGNGGVVGGVGSGIYNMSGTASFESRADTTGGNVQIFGAADGDPSGSFGQLTVADNAFYNGWETWFGVSNNGANNATGQLDQSGGTVRLEVDLDIGRENSSGEFNLSGGLVDVGRVELNDMMTPEPDDDVIEYNGALSIGRFDGSQGVFNINGDAATVTVTNFNVGGNFADTTAIGSVIWTPNATGVTAVDVLNDTFLGDAAFLAVVGSIPAGDVPLVNVGGSLTGVFANGAEGQLFGGGTHALTYVGGDGNDIVLEYVIPEPSSLLVALLGLASVAVRRR